MPPYIAVFIQNIGDKENPYVFAGTETNGKLISDVFDHGINHQCVTQSISIQRRRKDEKSFTRILNLNGVSARFIYTDCRLVYRCDEYDLGPYWYRSPMSIVMNLKEEHKAKKRMAGKLLLGHIRYEWIKEIAYVDRSIRVVYRDMEDTTYFIETSFDQSVDTSQLANDILHRACRYLLALTDQKDEEEYTFYTTYCEEVIPPIPGKELSRILFPTSYMAPYGKEYRPLIYEAVQKKSLAPMNPALDRVVGAADNAAASLNESASPFRSYTQTLDAANGVTSLSPTEEGPTDVTSSSEGDENNPLLKEYKELLDAGVISEQVYNDKKAEILKQNQE